MEQHVRIDFRSSNTGPLIGRSAATRAKTGDMLTAKTMALELV